MPVDASADGRSARNRAPVERPASEPASVQLDGIAHGGEAVGRLGGKAVFVPFGIPGEEVGVRITEDRPSYARARLVQVLRPSLQRRTPRCPHFGPDLCGGCHWQHVHYPLQLELKGRIVREQLERIGGLVCAPLRPVLGMEEPWGYRNHTQLLVGPDGTLSYQAAGTNRAVAVSGCPIAHPMLPAMVRPPDDSGQWRLPKALTGTGVRQVSLRAGLATGQAMMIVASPTTSPRLTANAGDYAVAVEDRRGVRILRGRPYLEERLAGRIFRFSPRSFFQVNTTQAEQLVELVRRYAALSGGESVLDCFCGVGVFGLLLAGRARRVTGIEESPSAVADARHNASGMESVAILQGRAEAVMSRLEEPVDVVVVDPPRQGCAPSVIAALARLAPARIVYVSCDPATLARDLGALTRAGYRLQEATPVDMFPQTYHIETVCLLTRAT